MLLQRQCADYAEGIHQEQNSRDDHSDADNEVHISLSQILLFSRVLISNIV